LGKYGLWEPTRPQKLLLSYFTNPDKSIFLYEGGNRGGKTFILVCLCLACLRGMFPWDNEDQIGWLWKLFGWEPPIKIRIIGQDWKKHIADVLIPTFKELIPTSWNLEMLKDGEIAISHIIDHKTGSEIRIVSNTSDVSNLEGWNGHFLAMDEPPDRDKRIACARGLTDFNGKEFFSMTMLKEPWIKNEIINAVDDDGNMATNIAVAHTTIYDNIGHGLTQKGVDNFSSKLTPEEREIRLDGIAAFEANIIWNIDRTKHILDKTSEDIRPNWLIDIQIDFHPGKPQYILFLATDENNYQFVVHSIVGWGNGEWIGDQIIKAVKLYSMRVNSIYADPLSKTGALNLPETEYDKIARVLGRFGYALENASSLKLAKEDGIMNVKNRLNTPNGLIALYFFKSCGLVIKQCMGWMYDKMGNPSKSDDDYCECLYRACLLDTEYYPPDDPDEVYYYEQVQRNKITGY
jgi:hypothetical protein